MKKSLLFLLLSLFLLTNLNAQFCNRDSCYREDSCFREIQIDSQTYKYATVHNVYKSSLASVNLYMTVYSPCRLPEKPGGKNDSLNCRRCKRPFILVIHGGGFRGGCRKGLSNECIEFAKRGYVAATIDYRLGWVPGDENLECYDNFCYIKDCLVREDDSCKAEYKDSMNFAMYRGLQDASAAMRFIAHYANNLNIDRNYLYLDGHSAGSILATSLTYTTQPELNVAIPGAMEKLGKVNEYGNAFKDSYKIAGLFNNWGSIADTLFINGIRDKIPMIAFHGLDDSIVPFAKGYPMECTTSVYGRDYGSYMIRKRLMNLYPDLPVELYACYGGHGILNKNPKTDSKSLYRIQKAICFFNRARNGDKTKTYIRIDESEDSITYKQLDSISPVSCTVSIDSDKATFPAGKNIRFAHAENGVVFTIRPNPAASYATLVIEGRLQKISITLTDLTGRILWSRQSMNEKAISLPTRDLAGGLYFVTVKANEYARVLKLIKRD